MIVYFTGTGNSRCCAERLAELLGEECRDVFHLLRNGIAGEFVSTKPWVFVAPTYSWRLPRVFAELIRTSSFSGSKEAYFVMTCGSDAGNAGAYNRTLCREKGFHDRGTLPVVMPENYVAMFPVPEAEEAQAIIAAAQPVLEEGAACIREGRDFPPLHVGAMDRLKSGIVNTLFYRFCVKAAPFTATDRCISCGKCEKVCPLGNIRMEEGRPKWGRRCTHCMACICLCPAEAVEYGRASRGKPRYHCPPDGEQ